MAAGRSRRGSAIRHGGELQPVSFKGSGRSELNASFECGNVRQRNASGDGSGHPGSNAGGPGHDASFTRFFVDHCSDSATDVYSRTQHDSSFR